MREGAHKNHSGYYFQNYYPSNESLEHFLTIDKKCQPKGIALAKKQCIYKGRGKYYLILMLMSSNIFV